jgi:sulfide:quinone oxidoreductase
MAYHPHILILGSNFAGLTTARYIRRQVGPEAYITAIDQKPYLTFVPNIPLEVWQNNNPAEDLQMPFVKFLERDAIEFVQAAVTALDVDNKEVHYKPVERQGSATARMQYDYVVIALGNKLAFDEIEGFGDHGHTFTDTYYGNQVRKYLHEEYRGGPVAIGSDRFDQGHSPKLPPNLPEAEAACEGPVVEVGFSMADWLEKHNMGDARKITMFTPAAQIAEDAGPTILNQLLPMVEEQGYGYKARTQGIKQLYKDGIEFDNGDSVEAELKIIFPNWQAHDFLKGLPIADDQGFIVTDRYMQNPDYPEVFAVGDAASITVPKLGSLGHLEAEVLAQKLASDIGIKHDEPVEPLQFVLMCMGDMGGHKGFYMHTDEWWGGNKAILKTGYTPHALKMGFKQMYYTLGGKIPSWGLPFSEFVGDHSIL